MSYPIASNLDMGLLIDSIGIKLRPINQIHVEYSDAEATVPISIEFIPDLSIQEQDLFNKIVSYVTSLNEFENLPDWATWTANDVETNIINSIFGGQSATAIKASIASQLTDITTANVAQINARLAIIRTLLGNAVDAIIAIRSILIAMGKAIIYLRNLVVKLR